MYTQKIPIRRGEGSVNHFTKALERLGAYNADSDPGASDSQPTFGLGDQYTVWTRPTRQSFFTTPTKTKLAGCFSRRVGRIWTVNTHSRTTPGSVRSSGFELQHHLTHVDKALPRFLELMRSQPSL